MHIDFSSFVLAAATADLSAEPAAREDADAVEFRLDLAADPLDALAAYDGELSLIATNRAAWEGGEATDDAARLGALEVAAEHDAVGAIDVELAALEDGDAAAVRAVWPPETRICRLTTECGYEGTWVGPEGDYLDGVTVETSARVANGSSS